MKYEMMNAWAIIGEVLLEEADQNEKIAVISTDSGKKDGVGPFRGKYPNRYYELGIAEQGATAFASGLATTGVVPVYFSPAPFATARAYEMLKIDVGYMNQNVKIFGRNCGFNYADLGPTHYGTEDLGLASMVPGLVILSPADASQLRAATRAALRYDGPVYLRFRTAKIAKIFEEQPFEIGKGIVLREGSDVAVFVTGEITSNALDAVERLVEKGIDPMVVSMPTVSPLDRELVVEAAKKCGKIVTVEEHYVHGGLGTAVSEVLTEECPAYLKKIGAPMEFIPAGPNADLLKYCGLDAEGIAKTVEEFIR